jgi:hypothetical protein
LPQLLYETGWAKIKRLRTLDEGVAELKTASSGLRDELASLAETLAKATQPQEVAVAIKHYGFTPENA